MIIRAEVVFIIELAGVSFVAYCAIEEAHSGRERVVSLVKHVSTHVCLVEKMQVGYA